MKCMTMKKTTLVVLQPFRALNKYSCTVFLVSSVLTHRPDLRMQIL